MIAVLCSIVANLMRGQGDAPIEPQAFLPRFDPVGSTPEELAQAELRRAVDEMRRR